MLTAESRESVTEMFNDWSRALEVRGMKVNLGKTKLLVSGKKSKDPISSGHYPCAVCSRGVGAPWTTRSAAAGTPKFFRGAATAVAVAGQLAPRHA